MARRTLLVIRHAKSDYPEGVEDRDRPLTDRGKRDAAALAQPLRDAGWPEVVLCSSAVRARQTWEAVEAAVDEPATVRYEPSLYAASARTMLGLVRGTPDDVARLAVVGHNPGMHELALDLAGSGEARAMEQLGAKLPTAAVAVLDVERPWRDLGAGDAVLRELHVGRG
jgi:phosphohistidine phosphatase